VRSEVANADEKLRDELRIKLGRAPLAKTWQPGTVFYLGDIASCDGATYQAKRDTCQPVTSDDWVCIARGGKDGRDARELNLRGAFNAHERYRQLDIVTCHDNSYIATCDDPGLPGHDDGAWQLLAKGTRGPTGDTGPRGRKGERGAPGANAPTIIAWTLDIKNYRAIPTMSDGRAGAKANGLRPVSGC
jgi:hypothetical protein